MKKRPADTDLWLSETVIWGHGSLVGRISPTGERLLYFRYRTEDGKRDTLPIGNYGKGVGLLTLEQARQRCLELAEIHKSGISNVREYLEQRRREEEAEAAAQRRRQEALEREQQARCRVDELFMRWQRVKLCAHKDGGAEVERIFRKDVLPEIGSLYADSVTKAHITQIADKQLARGTARLANRTFTLLRQMFRFALGRDIVMMDPTIHLTKADIAGRETERDRFLSEDEIRALAKQLPNAELKDSTICAVWICLSTCCRIGELSMAQWMHIDFNKSEWFIPAENTKNGIAHLVTLSAFSRFWFQRLRPSTGHTDWCFPNPAGTNYVSTKSITRQLSDRQKGDKQVLSHRSQKSAALLLQGGAWTPHDLRRTGATLMVANGVIPEVAERCLNHREENKIKRIYQRHSYQPEMIAAWQTLGALLTEMLDLVVPESEQLVSTSRLAG